MNVASNHHLIFRGRLPKGADAIAVVCFILLSGIAYMTIYNGSDDGQNETSHQKDYPGRTLVPYYWTNGNYPAYEAMGKYDANGTHVFNASGIWLYHPYAIGRLACEIYNHWYYTNDSTQLYKFRDQIAWMRANEKQFGDHSIWYYNYTASARQTNPWWSSLANAWIIASLLDSYALDKNPIDLEIAWRGIKASQYSMEDHGVLTNWSGTVWYEEEATNNTLVVQTPSHILNGMIFSMSGALYLYEFNNSAYGKQLFDDGMIAINTHVKEFDLGMWEKYSIVIARANPPYVGLHTYLFDWLYDTTNDTNMHAWWLRSYWMTQLPSIGYTPSSITASSTVDPSSWGTDRLMDKQLTIFSLNRYWSGYVPVTLTVDLGSSKSMNFIGFYGIGIGSAPGNFTIHTSLDGSNWALRGTILNSTDQDKCLAFNDSIQAQYVKFSIKSTNANWSVVGLDEVVIANLSADFLYEAKVAIEDHRFKNVDGRLTGTVPVGTAIYIDGNLTTDVGGSPGKYCYSLPNGGHSIQLRYGGIWLNRSMYVTFAQTVYYNATAQTFSDDMPVAVAGPNRTAVWNVTVELDGTASHDNQGIVNYTWTISDGGSQVKYGAVVTYRFQQLGNHTVSLQVRDPDGRQDTDSIWVDILPDNPPIAVAPLSKLVTEGEIFQLDGSWSIDDVGIVEYAWSVAALGVTLYGEQVNMSIMTPGAYQIVLTIKDTNGSASNDSLIVWVLGTDPLVADAGANQTVTEGTRVTFDGSLSNSGAGIMNYTWEFTYEGTEVVLYGPAPLFYFNATGTYIVTLTVLDGSSQTDNDTVTITVEGGIPIPEAAGFLLISCIFVIIAEAVVIAFLMRKGRRTSLDTKKPPEKPKK